MLLILLACENMFILVVDVLEVSGGEPGWQKKGLYCV